jgi:hypothetical protein
MNDSRAPVDGQSVELRIMPEILYSVCLVVRIQSLGTYGRHLISRALKLDRFSRQFKPGSQGFIDRVIEYNSDAPVLGQGRTIDGKTVE